MANARVIRGRRTQAVVAAWLREHGWLKAESVWGSAPGKDILNTPGHAIEVKARRDFDPSKWLRQSARNAAEDERPCVIVRMDGQGESPESYLVFRRLADDELNLTREAL